MTATSERHPSTAAGHDTQTALIRKYNVAGPRYTSYPTVPYWDEQNFTSAVWTQRLRAAFDASNADLGVSLYIHLPFCESLCTFCACNKRITRNHRRERPYIEALLKEWALTCEVLGASVVLREIHLGGGTPTFFSPAHLEWLMQGLLAHATLHRRAELSFEGHPNTTEREHLQTLYDQGFRRVSYGVQDYDATVQTAIHRVQTFERVQTVTEWARAIGYTSVGHDLIFGLPFQTLASMQDTITQTASLKPDRLAFYSYAHVPWIKGNGQRGFGDADLLSATLKRSLYEQGKMQLQALGYIEVGMDHFAVPTDSLYIALQQGQLHRNFMGYTTSHTRVMLGLGVSAIADSWSAFAQNEKDLERYMERVAQNELPISRGHMLSDEDLLLRPLILDVMCRLRCELSAEQLALPIVHNAKTALTELIQDGLLQWENDTLTVPERGRPFVRNICMAFDARLQRQAPRTALFSQTI